MRRLSLLAVLVIAAACGSDNSTPGGGGSSDPCTAFVTAVNTKAATCSLTVSSSYLPACQTAIASCTADDKTKIGNLVTCVNSMQACSSSNTSAFETAGDNCVNATAPTLSTACQNAMSSAANSLSLVSSGGGGGGGTFTGTGGSCTVSYTVGTASSSGCWEWSSSYAQIVPIQTACTQSCSGQSGSTCTYNSSACTSSGRIGRCIYSMSQSGQTVQWQISFYSNAGATAAQLAQACSGTTSGVTMTWVAN